MSEWHEELRKPFPAGTVGSIPKGGVQLDYVGHAAVTDRLLSIDPEWSWEPLGYDERGLPALDAEKNLWIKLTVCGVTRIGVGDGPDMKQRIGDALRNAAMRFGVALSLWSKDELESGYAEVRAPEAANGHRTPSVARGEGGGGRSDDGEQRTARAAIPSSNNERTQYSWINGGKVPSPDPKAKTASEAQHRRLFAIARGAGLDKNKVVETLWPGQNPEALDWRQMKWLSEAIEDGWRPEMASVAATFPGAQPWTEEANF